MTRLIRTLWEKEGIRYLFFGGLTTVVSTLTFWAALKAGLPYLWANVVSWVVAVAFAFVTNKQFVFRARQWGRGAWAEAARFAASRISTLLIGQAILYAGVEWLHLPEIVAKVVSQAAEIAANYILSKALVFVKGKSSD